MRIRRSAAVAFRFAYVPAPGAVGAPYGPATAVEERLVAISLAGRSHALGEHDLRALAGIPSNDWVDRDEAAARLGLGPGTLEALLEAGLLLCDVPDGPLAEMARQEARFAHIDWHDAAAHYHMLSRVRDQDAAEATRPGPPGGPAPGAPPASIAHAPGGADAREFAALAQAMSRKVSAQAAHKGPPPSPFHDIAGIAARLALPDPRIHAPLTRTLTERKTTRVFDRANPLTAQELSTLLYYTYGAQGIAQSEQGHASLRKTSPSGGAMHPIEAYPLVVNVRGVPSGLYHYSVQRHMLELLRPMPPAEAERVAELFTLGQSYFRSAHALFILTARWYRSFWKYPRAHKAYRVVHLDAGHLSQTLYLLCTQLGLGAFFTGAVNDMNIEEALGLDPLQEGVIGISGCGRPLGGGHALALQTVPYTPRPD